VTSQILHANADDLILWKAIILLNRSVKETIKNLDFSDANLLSPMDKLSEVFSEPLDSRHLHIAVRVPPAGEFEWLSA
jgi:hypothetical protein